MLFEIHMLKNFPSTNLNRDETGAPKTCYFGGSQRGRISSQCLKRSWRTSELFGALESRGWRSRNLPEMVAIKLRDMGVDESYIEPAKRMIIDSAKKEKKEKKEKKVSNDLITSQIIFFSPEDVQALADTVKARIDQSKDVEEFKKLKPDAISAPMKKAQARAITLDIALFGRMVTSDIILDVEAAMQVAHAVSTHPVNLESDYFTAVDDLIHMMDESGAGMIGDIDYDSCCYYMYASLDMDKLRENLKDSPESLSKVHQLLPVLLRVMAMSNPSGKQNSFAGHVLPEMIMVEVKKDKIPLSYANAFAEPVSRMSRKIVQDSIDKLVSEVNLMDDCYQLPVVHRGFMALRGENHPLKCECFTRFDQLVEACAVWAKE